MNAHSNKTIRIGDLYAIAPLKGATTSMTLAIPTIPGARRLFGFYGIKSEIALGGGNRQSPS